jgi:N-dimethylarginine dimethylaminohydrolase
MCRKDFRESLILHLKTRAAVVNIPEEDRPQLETGQVQINEVELVPDNREVDVEQLNHSAMMELVPVEINNLAGAENSATGLAVGNLVDGQELEVG